MTPAQLLLRHGLLNRLCVAPPLHSLHHKRLAQDNPGTLKLMMNAPPMDCNPGMKDIDDAKFPFRVYAH